MYDDFLKAFLLPDCSHPLPPLHFRRAVTVGNSVFAFNGCRLVCGPKNRFEGDYDEIIPNLPNYPQMISEYLPRAFQNSVPVRCSEIRDAVDAWRLVAGSERGDMFPEHTFIKLGTNHFHPEHFAALLRVADVCMEETAFLRCNSLGYPAVFAVDDDKVMMWPVGEDLARDCLPLTLNVGRGQ